jgi:hypothetical protein
LQSPQFIEPLLLLLFFCSCSLVAAATGSCCRVQESLLVLGKCVAALVQESSHVPYYESKLTLLLKAAFGGNSRTTLVVNCRGDDAHGDETLQVRPTPRCVCVCVLCVCVLRVC